MEKFKFDPKAKSAAYATYEILIKYATPILKKRESLELNKVISEIYLNVHLDESEEFIDNLKRLNYFAGLDREILESNLAFFKDHTSGSPLKTLNTTICELLNGIRIGEAPIESIIEKMRDKRPDKKRKSKTFIALGEGVLEQFKKDARHIDPKVIEYDKRRFNIWFSEVAEKGIEEVSKDETWGDHKLVRDENLKGKRSVKLSYAGRIIYKVDSEIVDDVIHYKVTIVKITSNHKYQD